MEKRILIAFVLSFLVLSMWSIINPSPQKTTKSVVQVIDNKELREAPLSNNSGSSAPVALNNSAKEEVYILENSKIKVEFSNIGGSIKAITIKEFNVSLPVTKIYSFSRFANSEFVFNQVSKNEISFSLKNGKQRIVQSYILSNDDYIIDANVQTDEMSNMDLAVYMIDSSPLSKEVSQSAERSLFEYSVGLNNDVIRKGSAIEFSVKENRNQSGDVSWIGYRDRYFCFVLKPKYKSSGFSLVAIDKKRLAISLIPANIGGNLNSYSATIYVGPQNLHLLTSYNKGFENVMVFSNWGILDIFAKMIYLFIHFLQGVLKSWGVAIIVLGVFLYLVTFPLTVKSMSSMRKMQAIQPKMKSLQEKHKKDPQRLNKEMMDLYKEHNINPFGGCLPMLLQMPIFYGLYQVLWRAVDFKGTNFLWIKDLSLPDRLAILPINLPIVGNEFNILPIVMAIIMFFQQKFSSRSMIIADENQLMQQKMMIVLMPVMMGFIFYHFASGLSLYFTVFYLLSTLTQWKMSKVSVDIK